MLWNKKSKAPARLHVKKGDKVVIISGQYKSNEPHDVLRVEMETGRIVVEGVNMRWKHQARSPQSPKGGRVQSEHPIAVSNVLLYSEKLKQGTRTKIEIVDGKRVRVGVKCGTRFDK